MQSLATACMTTCLMIGWSALSRGDVLQEAMSDELGRSMRLLRLEELEQPYFVSYRVVEIETQRISATFGGLLSQLDDRSRHLEVEVRVGDYQLDNSNFLSFPPLSSNLAGMFGDSAPLPLDDDYRELRRQIWLATDAAYKRALEDLAKKRAVLQSKTRAEELPDFSREPTVKLSDERPPPRFNQRQAAELVRRVSAQFRDMPDIFNSKVELEASHEKTRYLNSEGSSFVRTNPRFLFTVLAVTQATDGMPLEDFVAIYGRSFDDLPKAEELTDRVRAMGERLAMLRRAPLLDRYNGPALFSPQAAAELLNQALAPKLATTRRPVTDNPQFERLAERLWGSTLLDRVGARILPRFLSLVDDPTLGEYHGTPLLGTYMVDDEGVAAQETRLVEKGVLKSLLTARTPVPGILRSTGNCRGPGAVASNLILTSEMGLSQEELKAELLALMEEFDKEYGILIRRLGNPFFSLSQSSSRQQRASADNTGTRVGNVIEAYRVYPDGHEELIRNTEIPDVSLRSFKDIVAVSKRRIAFTTLSPVPSSSLLSSFAGRGRSSGAEISLIVPSLLFEEITLKRQSGEIPKVPVVRHPYFDRTSATDR